MTQPMLQDVAANSSLAHAQLLRAMFDSSDDAIIAKTLDGIVQTWNKGAADMYGYSSEEVVGQPVSMLCPPDRKGEATSFIERISRGERVTHYETMRQRKDGEVFPVSVSISPIRDAMGKLIGASSIVRDISEQVELREASARLRQQKDLEAANESLTSFTYSVAHDLRAPLRALTGYSDLLREEYAEALGETGRGYADRITAASQQMGMLIDNLLQLSRYARTEIHLQPVDLSAEVEKIAAELQHEEPGRCVRFAIQHPTRALADPTLIQTVLQNLVGNAWKFTSRRDDASIEFGTMPAADGSVCYYVRDNGAGFDPAYDNKLFQPFQRLHASSEFPGTGIGLASVRQIISRHDGRIWAEGAVGAGATFYFTLPGDPAPPDSST
jgi:PAS domain S-box-containing protein